MSRMEERPCPQCVGQGLQAGKCSCLYSPSSGKTCPKCGGSGQCPSCRGQGGKSGFITVRIP